MKGASNREKTRKRAIRFGMPLDVNRRFNRSYSGSARDRRRLLTERELDDECRGVYNTVVVEDYSPNKN